MLTKTLNKVMKYGFEVLMIIFLVTGTFIAKDYIFSNINNILDSLDNLTTSTNSIKESSNSNLNEYFSKLGFNNSNLNKLLDFSSSKERWFYDSDKH